MEHRTLMLLVGCGAAGAIAGIFKAPIAGLVFTLEVLMIDLTMSSLLPLLISAVTAATVSYIVTGTEAMFKFHLDQAFELERIPFVILLGIFCGLISLYFTRAMNSVEGVFGKLNNPYKKLAFGGVMLSVLIFLFPPLYGEGYDTINLLLNGTSAEEWDTVMNNSMFYGYGNLLLVYLMLIILLKVFASSATNGGGGCGGIFAPSLYLGCIAGFVFSHFSNDFAFSAYLPEKNFALMGMAGVMSGVMHAPLTGVFLIAELTGGYDLFLPLMIVSVSSYLTIIAFEPHSIYSMRLAKKGQLLTHHKDKAVLTLMKMENDPVYGYELAKLAVDKSARGLGLGEKLCRAAIAKAKSLSKKQIYIESNTRLKPAITLYKKLGFREIKDGKPIFERVDIQLAL